VCKCVRNELKNFTLINLKLRVKRGNGPKSCAYFNFLFLYFRAVRCFALSSYASINAVGQEPVFRPEDFYGNDHNACVRRGAGDYRDADCVPIVYRFRIVMNNL